MSRRGQARGRFGPTDVVAEITMSILERPTRTVLTTLGTVLGVAALVATLGLAQTAGGQIISRFDELEATQVRLVPADEGVRGPNGESTPIPVGAPRRLERLNGVRAAGTLSTLDVGDVGVRATNVRDPLASTIVDVPIMAASPGAFPAARASVVAGRSFDVGHVERLDRVAVVGVGAAERLGIHGVDRSPAVFVGEDPFVVIGIIDGSVRVPSLSNSIVITESVASRLLLLDSAQEVVIDVDVGAAALIGQQGPIAVAPNDPQLVRALVPPAPEDVRARVAEDVRSLFLVLGAVSVLVGAIGIANVTLASVIERTGEIGVRRALGATRGHIRIQFMGEAAMLGAIGGVVGTAVGVMTIVATSAARGWTPMLDVRIPLTAPLIGLVVGLVAGTYPASKAARLEPVDALRTAQ